MIQHKERAKQLLDFANPGNTKFGFTDTDACLEDGTNAVFIEVKYLDKDVPFGQKLYLERLTQRWEKSGGNAVSIHVSHNIHDPEKDVLLMNTRVISVYGMKFGEYGWYDQNEDMRLGELLLKLGHHWKSSKIISMCTD